MADHAFDPSQHPALTDVESHTVQKLTGFVREYFENPKFDASHDFQHVMRVTALAVQILNKEMYMGRSRGGSSGQMSAFVVIAGALLHDVEDRKYVDLKPGADAGGDEAVVRRELERLGVGVDEAERIRRLVEGVSYSTEVKDPGRTKELVREIPELGVVQDADRLDAIGAVGIGRCFTYGGAKAARSLQDSVGHFNVKLLKLEGMMKTETGKLLAAERSKRIVEFMSWWDTEMAMCNQ